MNKYDVIIIGAGPAGLTAALYLARNDMNVAFIEGYIPGGKMAEQSKIENYPGFSYISGMELSTNMLNQARENGAKFIYGMVKKLESIEDNLKKVILEDNTEYYAQAVIIATGMKNLVPMSIEGIEKFRGKGVSYCVLCDGALYKNKPTAIIGGGNSAFEEAPYLAAVASEVHMFIRDGIIAEKRLVEDVKKHNNIFIHENSEIIKLIGDTKIDKVEAKFLDGNKEMNIEAIFPYIGFRPATGFIENKNLLDPKGFIKVDANMETSEHNIFAIGDVIVKDVRQITTATNDGTIAAKVINSRIVK